MANTSRKHRDFVREPMGDKPVSALPGIGPVLAKELRQEGINKASNLLGSYLMQDRDPQRFGQWLKHTSGANAHQTGACTQALEEWSDNHL